jgi:hypothetical protein
MNKLKILLSLLLIATSCTIEDQVNPNNPSLETLLRDGATRTDLNNLVTGSLASMRTGYNTYVASMGTIARELYLFDADPRNTTDLIGTKGSLNNNTFYTTAPWVGRYATIKNLSILEIVVDASNVDPNVTAAEKQGYRALLKTIMAHEMLLLFNAQYDNGIRLDVSDPSDLGPIVTDEATILNTIATLLDEGYDELPGAAFAFTLTSGFEGFNTPATFGEFNRALAARVALYRGLYEDALDYLDNSFMDMGGSLATGPKLVYSASGKDLLNAMFKTPQQSGDQIIVNNHWIDDAEAGDLRVEAKAGLRDNPTSKSGLNGDYEIRLYPSAISPIDIISNEELILIYAECHINLNQLAEATDAIDVIRNAAGLDDLAVAKPAVDTQGEMLDELLHQRRYSLWAEGGHRAIDLRRYDRLNDTYVVIDPALDTDGNPVPQQIFTKFPVPATEN